MVTCKECLHVAVCGRYAATGGRVRDCEHFAGDSRWIPVTERLPDLIPCNAGTAYSEAVIVWTEGKKAMVAVWNGKYFLCAEEYWDAWGEKITHWMPMPTPPKGE